MISSNTNIPSEQKKSGWFSTILLVLILGGMGIYLLKEVALSMYQLANIADRPLYLIGPHNVVPLLFLIPTLFITAVGLILQELKLLTSENLKTGIRWILYCGVAFVVVRILYGSFYISGFMTSHGYSYCNSLTSASPLAPQIWVSDPGYCLEESWKVRSEVQDWLDERMAAGERPTPEEAEQKIKQLAHAYQARLNRF